MKYRIIGPKEIIPCEIDLPASKSISNRVLLINRMAGGRSDFLHNLSDCDDTAVMERALETDRLKVDIGAAGTAMRFLTAYYSSCEGIDHVLSGTERMQNRPISVLVEALRQVGAKIDYMEKEGYPPLFIHGKQLEGGEVHVDGKISSQYISALMMVAPRMKNGLRIVLSGQPVSLPYLRMTEKIMKDFGVEVFYKEDDNLICIDTQSYRPCEYFIESDWSAASYWYEILFLLKEPSSVFLKGLRKESLQGDAIVEDLFQVLGVNTDYYEDGVRIYRTGTPPLKFLVYDFKNCPDIVQTLAVACPMKGIWFKFKGLESLKIKETDRIDALMKESLKLGYVLEYPLRGCLEWMGGGEDRKKKIIKIETYNDHRMAMSFAPASILEGTLDIDDPGVVSKSYPLFWKHLETFGFEVKSL